MSLYGILGYAAIEEAGHRIAQFRASIAASDAGTSSDSFGSQVSTASDALAELDSVESGSDIVSGGLSVADIETLYTEVREEADLLFEKYRKAALYFSDQGITPTRQDTLRHISQNQTHIRIVHLRGEHIHALIDHYLEYSDAEAGERVSSTRYTADEVAAAEVREAEILLEAIIMSRALKSMGKATDKRKKEHKKEKKEEEREHQKFINQIVQENKRHRKPKSSKTKKK